jgi:Amino-terminal Zinc-binding domain of ubiquitin ligase E3A
MQEQKPTQDVQMQEPSKPGTEVTNVINADAEKKRKERLQTAFKKFIVQLKTGCDKQICFNQYCKKNIFRKSQSSYTAPGSPDIKFDNDQAIVTYALKTL